MLLCGNENVAFQCLYGVAATTTEDNNQMQSSALFSNDHTSFARPGLDRE
jgi:hypothetical protein